ncbi:DNA cytosine methyltransferase [Chroococcidiopsis sp.]|uniref:DNA cytosine methyltransferase n=1 Tax=Chroococcidiopsis sp. TaxID=3088168 RepID=UPI003F34FE78
MYSVLSLFSGIGSLCELGIREAGLRDTFRVAQFVEANLYRQQILKRHYPNTPIHSDIRTYTPDFKPDVLIGGFPCRGLSAAGAREGLLNPHSNLWFEMLRIIDESRPTFVVIENVAGFVNRGLRAVLGGLRMVGYEWEDPQIVSAKELGAPHLRERVFVIAYPSGLFEGIEGVPTAWGGQVGDSIKALTNSYNLGSEWQSKDWIEAGTEFRNGTEIITDTNGNGCKGQAFLEIETRRNGFGDSIRTIDSQESCIASAGSRIHDGNRDWLHGYHSGGWWDRNQPPTIVCAPPRTIPNRHERIAALGDTCTPQQAAVVWARVASLARPINV